MIVSRETRARIYFGSVCFFCLTLFRFSEHNADMNNNNNNNTNNNNTNTNINPFKKTEQALAEFNGRMRSLKLKLGQLNQALETMNAPGPRK